MLQRNADTHLAVVVGAAVADSDEIPYGNFAGGRFHVPAGSSITTITWYDAPVLGGTYLSSYTEAGVAITQTVAAGKSYEIPLSLASARALKAVGNAAGTIDVCLKA